MSQPETTSQPGSGDLDGRPGRWGLFFIAIWTLFLIQPLAAGWDQRDRLSGWVGMLGTLAFAAAYIAVFARRRMSMREGSRARRSAGHWPTSRRWPDSRWW